MRLDDLALMVSEVVANAVRHGSPEADGNIGLRLEGDQDVLRVVVTDGGEDFAFDPGSVEDARNGHFGLLFVDRLADRWGLSLDGKTAVWLEVDNPPNYLTLPSGRSEPVEGIRLWRDNRQKLVGMVYLDKGVLDLDIQDDHERALVEEVFEQTGQVTWSFSRFDEGEWQENVAEPRTERWLWFVVANILYPMGYQADLGVGEDG